VICAGNSRLEGNRQWARGHPEKLRHVSDSQRACWRSRIFEKLSLSRRFPRYALVAAFAECPGQGAPGGTGVLFLRAKRSCRRNCRCMQPRPFSRPRKPEGAKSVKNSKTALGRPPPLLDTPARHRARRSARASRRGRTQRVTAGRAISLLRPRTGRKRRARLGAIDLVVRARRAGIISAADWEFIQWLPTRTNFRICGDAEQLVLSTAECSNGSLAGDTRPLEWTAQPLPCSPVQMGSRRSLDNGDKNFVHARH